MVKTMFLYGTDDVVVATCLDGITCFGRRVWESDSLEWYVTVLTPGGEVFMEIDLYMRYHKDVDKLERMGI